MQKFLNERCIAHRIGASDWSQEWDQSAPHLIINWKAQEWAFHLENGNEYTSLLDQFARLHGGAEWEHWEASAPDAWEEWYRPSPSWAACNGADWHLGGDDYTPAPDFNYGGDIAPVQL